METKPLNFDPRFTHVVYFWLEDPENESDRKIFEAELQRLVQKSEYAKTGFIGIAPKATREVVDDSFSYSLILTFESAEAQELYQTEPVHEEFVEKCKSFWKKVVVYDAIPIEKK